MNIISKLSIIVLALGLVLTGCKKTAGDKAATGAAKEVAAKSAAAITYNVTKGASKVYWTGSKPTGSHMGTIDVSGGALQISNGTLSGGSFTLDMNSITCTDLEGEQKAGLEGHLKGLDAKGADDFFNVNKYPSASFTITSVVPSTTVPDANVSITGNLKMKDTEKSITFPASVVVLGDKVSAVTPPFKINRTEWGINYGSKTVFNDLKDKFINDDISLNISLETQK